jgi:hypothetical protein
MPSHYHAHAKIWVTYPKSSRCPRGREFSRPLDWYGAVSVEDWVNVRGEFGLGCYSLLSQEDWHAIKEATKKCLQEKRDELGAFFDTGEDRVTVSLTWRILEPMDEYSWQIHEFVTTGKPSTASAE